MVKTVRELAAFSLIGVIGILAAFFSLAYPLPAQASEAPFYAGKRLTLYVGYAPGGGFDLTARLVGRHFSKFIPGNPRVLVKNMPGAGGMVLANFLYNMAKPDGLEIGTVGRSGPVSELLGRPEIHFDARKFKWIGSPSAAWNALFIRADLGIRTIEDLKRAPKKIIFVGLRPDASNVIIPRFFQKFFGWPIRVVAGYTGTGAALAAVERGEGDAYWNPIESTMGNRRDLVEKRFLITVVQDGPYFSGVPTVQEAIEIPPGALSAAYDFLKAPELWGVAIAGPPGMPKERTQVLRESFMRMARSEAFLSEAKRLGMLGIPLSGEEVEKLVRHVFEQVKANPEVTEIVARLAEGR